MCLALSWLEGQSGHALTVLNVALRQQLTGMLHARYFEGMVYYKLNHEQPEDLRTPTPQAARAAPRIQACRSAPSPPPWKSSTGGDAAARERTSPVATRRGVGDFNNNALRRGGFAAASAHASFRSSASPPRAGCLTTSTLACSSEIR